MRNKALQYIASALLAVVTALNYEIFVFPNAFAPAGINGLATMVQYVFDFSVGYLSLIVNIPLVIAAFFVLDREYAIKMLLHTLTFSMVLLLLKNVDLSAFQYNTISSTILGPVAAGIVNGAVYAGVIRIGGATGGTDVIAALIRKKRPYVNLMWLIFTLNAVVAGISFFVYHYRIEPVLCCLIYCFITSTVSDRVVQGWKQALKFEVVTSHADELCERLLRELKHGATVVPAKGMYTHDDKDLVICIINKHQIVEFTNIIRDFPDTFAFLSSVSETVGNFKKVAKD